MAERVFTVEEADRLLPRINELLDRAEAAAPAGHPAAGPGIGGNGSATRAAGISRWQRTVRAVLTELEELGIVVRDLSSGLLDFPAMRDGEPIYLCWRRGEGRVAHWHDRVSGFSGRRPLDP